MNLETTLAALLGAVALITIVLPLRYGRSYSGVALFGLVGLVAIVLSARYAGAEYRAGRALPKPTARPLETPGPDYTSSKSCRSCHPGEYDSWHHSFHRTMTQEPTPETVAAEFDGQTVQLSNGDWKFERVGDEFFVEMAAYNVAGKPVPGAPRERRRVGLVTGSHHMQAFWLETMYPRKLDFLPALWLIEEGRWITQTASFIMPPDTPCSTEPGRWNEVCIHCHTTRGRPGRRNVLEMDTRVAEFGIACEACHGPAAEHARFHSDPFRRYTTRLGGKEGAGMTDPLDFDPARGSLVCGQCHGSFSERNKECEAIALDGGFAYRPGDANLPIRELLGVSDDYELTSKLGNDPDYLKTLFWSDGMIRVSGREYNGLIESPCHIDGREGGMSCFSCHEMHMSAGEGRTLEDWRDDQLKAGMRSDEACLQCHGEFRGDISRHTAHAPGSSGSRCYNCHMPYTTYGLLKAIRSHTVSSPSVVESLQTGRPNACNQCHIDKPLEWTCANLKERYGIDSPPIPGEDGEVATALIWGLKGDAGQRALTAWALGWDAAREAAGEDWQAPLLGQLLTDSYPAVRLVAERSLRKYIGFEDLEYDHEWDIGKLSEAANRTVERWRQLSRDRSVKPNPATLTTGPGEFDRARFVRLSNQRNDRRMTLNE